ncbi:MlaD family protein [Confluentibacter citreus]|uniref:MlaD family protein n=1 Tax=Confluentibacter citreus TaxID=2007307 RepID=UPI000C292DB9|nr:MlaD family protein [Confluentibacter citreus]
MGNQNNSYKIKLGIFVSLGLVLLFGMIFLIGSQQNLFKSTTTVITHFNNASGLKIGNQVRFSGISIGTVDNIEMLNDTTVKVVVMIDTDIKKFIKKDSKASIASDGVVGDKILMISQGSQTSKEIVDGDAIKSFEPVEFDQIMTSIQITAENAEVITDELATLLWQINNGEGTLGRLLGDEGMAENLDKTMENLKNSSQGLEENMEAAKSNFLLRGYFKRKEREKEKAQKEAEEAAKEAAEKLQEEKK